MRVVTQIGEQLQYHLSHALLIYRDGTSNRDFATVHEIVHHGDQTLPHIGPGRLLSTDFLRQLAAGLRQPARAVVLPENVLAYNSELLVWWTPPWLHSMFFSDGAEDRVRVHGRVCPHPALVWKVKSGALQLRALVESVRPGEDTTLMVAPYWNTEPGAGRVCEGSMPRPRETNLSNMAEWENGFFVSRFTHPSGMGKLTCHPGGFIGLWTELAGQAAFPAKYLVSSRQTLRAFVEDD